MLTISQDRIINIWMQLEDAYRDENSYGGTDAEIYRYMAVDVDGAYINWANNGRPENPILGEEFLELERQAKENLATICKMFEKKRHCEIVMVVDNDNEYSLDHFLNDEEWAFTHREYVRVK